jgi:nucleoside-diphosphate-sugar epimerase
VIIGNGLVAKSFKKEKKFFGNIIVFASGLANSKNINKKEFVREKKLLKKFLNIKKKKLIYFSTLDIFRKKKNAYTRHKINIENILKKKKNILIIRLPQLIGKSNNKHTIFNFLNFNLRINKKIKIFVNYYRNFIDVDDLIFYVKKLIKNKINFNIINIYNKKSIKIVSLLKIFKKQGIIKNKIFTLDKTNDNFFKNMTKFSRNKNIVINKKNYYKKLFKKYI